MAQRKSAQTLAALKNDPKKLEELKSKVDLPDIKEIKVVPLTKKQQKQINEEYRKRRAFAEGAGKKIAIINREIADIESNPERLELSPTLQERLKELKAALAKLQVGDEGVEKHTKHATLIAEIRLARPEEFLKYFGESKARGIVSETNQVSGPHLFFVWGKAYEVMNSPGAHAVEAELRKLQSANRKYRQNAYREAVTSIKGKATQGLTLTRVVTENPTPLGLIYGYLPPRKEPNPRTQEKSSFPESHLLVECDGKIIKPIEAVGRSRGFFSDLAANGRYVSVADLKEGRVSGRLPEEIFKELSGFLGILQATLRTEAKN